MKADDLSPREQAARSPGYRSGWELAESEDRIEAEDVLSRIVQMALHEFGKNQNEWPMTFDDEGFIAVLTAEGIRLEGGLSIHVWPNDHPPPHVHILKQSESDSSYIKINLATGALEGDLPDWANAKQLKKMQALVVKHHGQLAAWWEKNHGEAVVLLGRS
jgi:hypothetical protein